VARGDRPHPFDAHDRGHREEGSLDARAAHWKWSTSTSLSRPAVTDDADAVLLRASISGREA
jgi:hypothetical protein